MSRFHVLLAAPPEHRPWLARINACPGACHIDESEFACLDIGTDTPDELHGIADSVCTPTAIVNVSCFLMNGKAIDDALIDHITGLMFRIPAQGFCVSPEQLNGYLRANLGRYLICTWV